MKMPLFGIGMQNGVTTVITAKLLTNIYCETRPQGEKSSLVGIGFPGLDLFVNFGATPTRGMLAVEQNDLLYAVHRAVLKEVNNAGVVVDRGMLNTSSGSVGMAHNGAQVMIVDGTNGYIYVTSPTVQNISSITRAGTLATLTTALPHSLGTGMTVTIVGALPAQYNGLYTITVTGPTTFTYVMASDPGSSASPTGSYSVTTSFAQITDPDFPANPTSVTFQDGYFIAGFDNGKFYISALYDGLSWDALDFTTANSIPDKLIRIFSDHGELVAFQDTATSFFGNTGAVDFPFAKIQGADAEWGCGARYSVVKFDDSVAFLCKNRMGEVIIGKLSGHSMTQISTPDLDKIINSYSVTSDAIAFSYLLGGHPMYQINFPSAGYSWSYDSTTGIWSKRKSSGITRQICERGTPYLSRIVMSDYSTGQLYRLSPTTLTENGATIEGEIIGEHWDQELAYITIDRIRLDMEVGTGNDSAPATQVMMQLSRNDGKTYGTEMWRSAGLLGHYKRIVEWRRLGTTRRINGKWRITDVCRRVITGVYLNPKD